MEPDKESVNNAKVKIKEIMNEGKKNNKKWYVKLMYKTSVFCCKKGLVVGKIELRK